MDGPTLDPGARQELLRQVLGWTSQPPFLLQGEPVPGRPCLSSVLFSHFFPDLSAFSCLRQVGKSAVRGDASRVSGLGTKMAQAIPWRRWGDPRGLRPFAAEAAVFPHM